MVTLTTIIALLDGILAILIALVLAAAAVGLWLAWHLSFPRIIPYPWPEEKTRSAATAQQQQQQQIHNDTVLMAGSFHPPHLGHIAMIAHIATLHAKVIVVVGMNPQKQYTVTPHQRADLLRTCLAHLSPRVEVRVVAGLIWQRVPEAKRMYRGIRTWAKDGREERYLQFQNLFWPPILGPWWRPRPTVYIMGNPKFNHISSTHIRDCCRQARHEELAALVPATILPRIMELYK